MIKPPTLTRVARTSAGLALKAYSGHFSMNLCYVAPRARAEARESTGAWPRKPRLGFAQAAFLTSQWPTGRVAATPKTPSNKPPHLHAQTRRTPSLLGYDSESHKLLTIFPLPLTAVNLWL